MDLRKGQEASRRVQHRRSHINANTWSHQKHHPCDCQHQCPHCCYLHQLSTQDSLRNQPSSTSSFIQIKNYILYKGATSIGSETYAAEKLPTCRACLTRVNRLPKLDLTVTFEQTIHDVLSEVRKKYEYINKPFLSYNGHIMLNPGDEERYAVLLKSTIGQLIT